MFSIFISIMEVLVRTERLNIFHISKLGENISLRTLSYM